MSKNLLGSDFTLDLGRKLSQTNKSSCGIAACPAQRKKEPATEYFSGKAPYLFIRFINLN